MYVSHTQLDRMSFDEILDLTAHMFFSFSVFFFPDMALYEVLFDGFLRMYVLYEYELRVYLTD